MMDNMRHRIATALHVLQGHPVMFKMTVAAGVGVFIPNPAVPYAILENTFLGDANRDTPFTVLIRPWGEEQRAFVQYGNAIGPGD